MIAVGFSTTFQDHAGVLQKVVDAAADLPVRSLVTLGEIREEEVRPAANSVLVPRAPHDAVMRKAFNIGSNAYLEIQWYLFAAVFLLVAGDTLRRQAHVRIDVLSARWSKRTQAWIDTVKKRIYLLRIQRADIANSDSSEMRREFQNAAAQP